MYILPTGARTSNWEAFDRAWRKFLKKYAKAVGFSIESVNGDCVTFGRHIERSNGKSALMRTIGVSKDFLVPAVYAWLEANERYAELKDSMEDIEFDEDEVEEAYEDSDPELKK